MLTPPIRLRMIRFGTFQIDPDNREPCITRPSADWHSFPELEGSGRRCTSESFKPSRGWPVSTNQPWQVVFDRK